MNYSWKSIGESAELEFIVEKDKPIAEIIPLIGKAVQGLVADGAKNIWMEVREGVGLNMVTITINASRPAE